MNSANAREVQRWRNSGLLVVDSLFEPSLIEQLQLQAEAAEAAKSTSLPWKVRFPAEKGSFSAMNRAALHEPLICIAAQLLGGEPEAMRLVMATLASDNGCSSSSSSSSISLQQQSRSSPRQSETNHVAVPSTTTPEAVLMRLTLPGAEGCGVLQPGSASLYRLDTCDITSVTRDESQCRGLTFQVILRHAAAEWVSSDCFCGMVAAGGSSWVGSLSPLQRTALGFPRDRHPYWNEAALRQMDVRYPGFTATYPYDALLSPTNGSNSAQTCRPVAAVDPAHVATFMSEAERLERVAHSSAGSSSYPWRSAAYCTHGGDDSGPHGRRWLRPERFEPQSCGGDGPPASPSQVAQWQDEGWLLIDGLFPEPLLSEASAAAARLFPDNNMHVLGEAMGEAGHHAGADEWPPGSEYEGQLQISNAAFPFQREAAGALNAISLHPRLLALVAQLLGCVETPEELRLTQCFVTAKYGGPTLTPGSAAGWHSANDHQPMHRDVGTNSLLEPARDRIQWHRPEEVQGILYYADAAEAGAPTAFVPGLRYSDPARDELYVKERWPRYQRGTLLLWQLGLWHRGVPATAGSVRRKHHFSFRRAGIEWAGGSSAMGQPSARSLYSLAATTVRQQLRRGEGHAVHDRRDNDEDENDDGDERRRLVNLEMGRFLGAFTPLQRTVMVGFPPLGSAYWDAQTISGTRARYGGHLALEPYVAAMRTGRL